MYEYFEPDYLRRAMLKDLKKGRLILEGTKVKESQIRSAETKVKEGQKNDVFGLRTLVYLKQNRSQKTGSETIPKYSIFNQWVLTV